MLIIHHVPFMNHWWQPFHISNWSVFLFTVSTLFRDPSQWNTFHIFPSSLLLVFYLCMWCAYYTDAFNLYTIWSVTIPLWLLCYVSSTERNFLFNMILEICCLFFSFGCLPFVSLIHVELHYFLKGQSSDLTYCFFLDDNLFS